MGAVATDQVMLERPDPRTTSVIAGTRLDLLEAMEAIEDHLGVQRHRRQLQLRLLQWSHRQRRQSERRKTHLMYQQ